MREQFTVVALPYSCHPDSPFHVSFFVSPDIEVDHPDDTLAVTTLFEHWTTALGRAHFILEDQSGEIECQPLLGAIEDGLWEEVFPSDTPVASYVAPDWNQRPWRTFHPGRTTGVAKTVNLLATLADGVEPPTVAKLPWYGKGFERILSAQEGNPLERVDGYEQQITALLDRAAREGVPLAEFGDPHAYFDLTPPVDNVPGGAPMAAALLELHQARRFYSHPEEETDYESRPAKDDPGPPPPDRQIPDFHARVSLVNDHGPLQRKLGLVVDMTADVGRLARSEWLLGRILVDGRPEPVKVVRVACRRVGRTLVTRAADEKAWINGRLPVGDADAFDVLDLDPDGTALKTELYLSSYLRTTAASLAGAPVNAAPPALRSGALTVARRDNAATTAGAMTRQGGVLDQVRTQPPNLPAPDAPLLTTEDVIQGVRVEVHDDRTGAWRSLHRVHVNATVVGGRTLEFDDVAFLQETAPTHSGTDTAPVHVHEAVFGWDGWSLSAARPALPVVHEGGTEHVVTDPQPPADPSTPVLIERTASPGTLPRLRFGRDYSFRVWGVDLACNSRPHREGTATPADPAAPPDAPPAAAEPEPAAPEVRVTADLGGLADFSTTAIGRLRTELDVRRAPAGALDASGAGSGLKLAETLPQVIGRLQALRGDRADRPVTSSRADVRAVLASGLADDSLKPAATAVVNPRVVRSGLALDRGDLAGPIGALEPRAISPEVRYVRWQPVQPPALVPRRPYSEGESNLVMVVRSGVAQDPATLTITGTGPTDYAASHPGRHDTCERHLVPPKTSQFEAELHGAFDAAIGSADPAARNLWLHAAIRESGTLFDLDVPRLDDPSIRDAQDGIDLAHSAGASPGELRTLPLPPGEAPGPGQYVIHDTGLLHTPYLPDVLARGLGFVFPDAGDEWRIIPPFGLEGFTTRYEGTWPEIDGYRLVLDGATELRGAVDDHLITLSLPAGTTLRTRVSSSFDVDDLEVLGVWRQLPPAIREFPGVAQAAANGWLWALSPADSLTLVHAVPRPVAAPEPIGFAVHRVPDATSALLVGGVGLHGPSTDSLVVDARWDEVLDDLSDPASHVLADQRQVACTTAIEPWEDIALLLGGHDDQTFDDQTVGHVRVHRAVHEFGDTRHRLVHYRLRATTRFREYFTADELAPLPPSPDPALPVDDGQSTVSGEIDVHVPNTSLPAPPMVHSAIPLFRWEEATEPDQPLARRRSRRSGVRIYLERPWFTTGADEQVGVVLAVGERPATTAVSQWGGDPFWIGSTVADRDVVQLTDFLAAVGIDDYDSVAGPSGKPMQYPSADDPGTTVWVVPYTPQYNQDRRKWFVDIGFPARFWPFVQLAIVRYQPYSVPGRHVSKPVLCDFVQIAPERTASVSRTSEGRVRVLVAGPAGVHDLPGQEGALAPPTGIAGSGSLAGALLASANRVLRAKLQVREPGHTGDLDWETVQQTDLTVRGIEGNLEGLVWIGELDVPESLPFTRPTTPGTHRVRIEEWEVFTGDPVDLGDPHSDPTTEARLIYADEFELGDPAPED